MTTTIIYSQSDDGYLVSTASTNAAAASGTALSVTNNGTGGYSGQWYDSTQGYRHHETFIGFTYTAIPSTELVTAVALKLSMTTITGPSITRALEARGIAWRPTLTTAKWKTTSQLAGGSLFATINGIQGASGKTVYGGTDLMIAAVPLVTSMDFVLVTDRQRAALAPTASETQISYLSEGAGTTYDPALIISSVTRSTLVPVLGCQARLSDGTWAVLKSSGNSGTPTITLNWLQTNGTETLISTLPTGGTSTSFDYGDSAQSFALVADSSDNLYVIGKVGNSGSGLALRAYQKGGTAGSWTSKSVYSASMPSYTASINNVAAAWHNINGGTLAIFTGHNVGNGVTGGTGNDVTWMLVNCGYLLTNGTGTLVNGSGSALGGALPAMTTSDFNSYANETGTGLDVVNALGTTNPGWGYVASFEKGVPLGSNGPCSLGRYILSSTGTSFTHASSAEDCTAGVKDAGGKVRAVAIDSSVTALVSTNSVSGAGISVSVQRHSGTTSGSVQLGYVELSGESIASMPAAATVSTQSWWDAVYNSADNRLWVYYVSATNALQIMRTAVDMSTYQPVRNEVVVATMATGATVQALRVERYTAIQGNCLVTIAYKTSGGTFSTQYTVDQFAVSPYAPTLTSKANFDASTSQVFAWTFADPNPTDTQSAYQMQVVDTATGTITVDTGQITSATASRTVAANTLANTKTYQWRVRTWDQSGLVGPYSAYSTFSTGAGGSVVITDPAVDNQAGIISNDYRVAWTVTGTTQASYRVKVVRTSNGSTLSDSGYVASTLTTYQLPGGMLSDVEYQIQVSVRNASSVESPIGTRLITPSYAYPPQPIASVSAVESDGYILVSAENPVPGAAELGVTPYYFETGVSGFTATSCTFTQSSAQAHEGTYSAAMVTTGTPTSATVRVTSATAVAVNVGSRYTARFWGYSTAGYGTVSVTIDWLNSSKTLLSSSATTIALPAGSWTEFLITAVAPANAAYAVYGPTIGNSPAAGTTVYVDELVLLLANDIPDASYNRVLRRVAGSSDPYAVLGTFDPGEDFRDYTAAGGVSYEYRVVAVGQ